MSDTVTISREDYQALLDRAEDAEDALAVAQSHAQRVALGDDKFFADTLPVQAVKRIIAGESPVRIWREHRGIKAVVLAERAEVSASYLNEIETGKKPGSLATMAKIARALDVPLDNLA